MKRFERVVAANSVELINELNRRGTESWFSVIFITEQVAVLDYCAALVQPVEIEESVGTFYDQADGAKFA
jgi:hypothetical protein